MEIRIADKQDIDLMMSFLSPRKRSEAEIHVEDKSFF